MNNALPDNSTPRPAIELTIIIVSYNTRQLTLECLESVFAQTQGITFEVIVVDNASADGSAEAIAARFPQIRLIPSKENLGFAQANNLAAAEARGKNILLLNPDTVVLDGAIQTILAFSESHPEADIFGGRTLFPDRSLNPASCWGRPTPWSIFCRALGISSVFRKDPVFDREAQGSRQIQKIRPVDIVSGCFLLIRKNVWDELKGFDPMFFMYGEDADLCLRAWQSGHVVMVNPQATIIHYLGASEKTKAGKTVKLFRAKAQLFDRFWSPSQARLGERLLDVHVAIRKYAYRALRRFKTSWNNDYMEWAAAWQRRSEWHVSRQTGRRPASFPHLLRNAWNRLNRLQGIYNRRGLPVRLIYLAFSLAYWVLTGFGFLRRGRGIILCYHGISNPQKGRFADQMRSIAPRTVSIESFFLPPQKRRFGLPKISVTFDDGYLSILHNVLPITEPLRVPILVFLVAGKLGGRPFWLVDPRRDLSEFTTLMSRDIIAKLSKNPLCTFGSHTFSHIDVPEVSGPEAQSELIESRKVLQDILGHPVEDFAFPYGSFTPATFALARQSGYRRVFTLDPCCITLGLDEEPAGRFLMSPDAWKIEFFLTCAGAYAWLSPWRKFLSSLRELQPARFKLHSKRILPGES